MTGWTVVVGDSLEVLAGMEPESVDAIVTDPPYGLEFMGREWDAPWKTGDGFRRARNPADVGRDDPFGRASARGPEYRAGVGFQAWCEAWARHALRALKPGGHLLAFGGTRTSHRLVCGVEDAGFEVRDTLAWLYGSGFPKSLNVGCRCGGEATSEHDVPSVLGADVSAAGGAPGGAGSLLLEGVSQPGAPSNGAASGQPAHDRSDEPGMAGRRDAQAPEGELRRGAARAGAGVGAPDGAVGRVRGGAPADGGGDDRAGALADGGRASSGPRPVAQRAGEPRALADERGAQDGRGWAHCPRCGLPTAGLGTALKPAHEPVVAARKPLAGNVAQNVLAHGTGALNVDGCRIAHDGSGVWGDHGQDATKHVAVPGGNGHTFDGGPTASGVSSRHDAGRWPANVVLDESSAAMLDAQTGERLPPGGPGRQAEYPTGDVYGDGTGTRQGPLYFDHGGASRFFYCAKASTAERNALDLALMPRARSPRKRSQQDAAGRWAPRVRNRHPTVKPVELMRWLVRLVTPPGGLVVDPFAGSGTTGCAAVLERRRFLGIERDHGSAVVARARIGWWAEHPDGVELVRRLEREAERAAVAAAGQEVLF